MHNVRDSGGHEASPRSDEPPKPSRRRGAAIWGAVAPLGPLSGTAIRITLALVVLCGVVFPLVVWGIGQVIFPSQANGSLIRDGAGRVIGSALIGQSFTRAEYFHGRPSAVGYNAASSGGSNIGPTNPQLLAGNGSTVTVAEGTPAPANGTPVAGQPGTYYTPGSYAGAPQDAAQFRQENHLAADTPLPPDIISASGSGLDPDISVAAANLQVPRVVAARQALGGQNATLTAVQVQALIDKHTAARDLGVLGEPRVNVLELNLDLDASYGPPPAAR